MADMNKPFRLGRHPCLPNKLLEKIGLSEGVYELRVSKNFSFRPGQVVAVSLPGLEQSRLYSIASGAGDDYLGFIFDVNPIGYLTPLLSNLQTGDQVLVSEPFGEFICLDEKAFWIAAGTGIAPFRSMLRSGKGKGKTLVHGGRMETSFYYSMEFENSPGLSYIKCSSSFMGEGFYPGRITEYLERRDDLPGDQNFYLCGSAEMVMDVRNILVMKHISLDHIIAEIYF